MPLTDLQGSLLSYKSYYETGFFDAQKNIDQVEVYFKFYPDQTAIVFPGSRTETDWIRDFASFEQVQHAFMGPLPLGFAIGEQDTYAVTLPMLPKNPVIIIGHSLGGPRCDYLAANLINGGMSPDDIDVLTFESPNSGSQLFKDILAAVRIRRYRMISDGITALPTNAIQSREPFSIFCEPIIGDILPTRYHHIQNVVCAMALREFDNGKPAS